MLVFRFSVSWSEYISDIQVDDLLPGFFLSVGVLFLSSLVLPSKARGYVLSGCGVSLPGPYLYNLPTYHPPSGVSSCRITRLITSSCSTVVAVFLDRFAPLTEFYRCWLPFSCLVVYIAFCRVSVTCCHVDDSEMWSIEKVIGIPSPSIISIVVWTMSTLYSPDAHRSKLLYRRLAIFIRSILRNSC